MPRSPRRRAMVAYTVQILVLMVVIYPALLLGSQALLHSYRLGVWRVPVAVVPLLPVLLVGAAVGRYLARADELERRIQLEAIAVGFFAMAGAAITSTFLQAGGLGTLPQWLIFVVGPLVWLVVSLGLRLRYR